MPLVPRAALMLVAIAAPAVATVSPAVAGDWPSWRGPHGTGAADEADAPLRWSAAENVVWKVPLAGPGNSSPVVARGRVFLTQATEKGRRRSLLCFDRTDGRLLWERAVAYEPDEPTHQTNPHGSASPVTDGEVVVAWHGSAGLFAFGLDGEELWRKDLGEFRHVWGYGSSPAIHGNLVIMNAGPGLRAFVAAFDRRTGAEAWRREFPGAASEKIGQYRGSWATPIVRREEGRDALLLPLPGRLYALDPATGGDLWSCGGLGELCYAQPLVAGGVAVAFSGYHGPSLGVRTGGSGDVTATHRLWLHEGPKLNPQRVGSGVAAGGSVYLLNETGVAWCLNPESGEIRWQRRIGGTSWSSMSHVAGRLYVNDTAGTTYVLDADPAECRVLAENRIPETTRASPAYSDGQVFIRTYEHLYCIGGR